MALKPTIYKFSITLSDLNRNYYDSLTLTVAQHPSETLERMMARVVAYCIYAEENLTFTKGLSAVDEPDIWAKSLDDQLMCWIDVGEPDVERVRKATRLAQEVKVVTFNSKSDVWWSQSQDKFDELNVSVLQLPWSGVQVLAKLVQRTLDMSVTITGDSAFIAADSGECEIAWLFLKD